jgi:hypothetical protein
MNNEKLTQKIEILEQKMQELESRKGFKGFMKKSLSKMNVIVGCAIAIVITSAVLFAAQITFTDGTVISAADVNANFTELYNSTVKAESFLGYLNNSEDIKNNNGGYTSIKSKQNTNGDIFEEVSDVNYGIRIKKAGKIFFHYFQDIVTNSDSNSTYVILNIFLDGVLIGRTLMRPTDEKWDEIQIGGAYNVNADQVLTAQIVTSSSSLQIQAIDGGSEEAGLWGELSIMWIGH